MTPDDRARLISSLALATPAVRYLAAGLVGPETRPRAAAAAIQPATGHLVVTTMAAPNTTGPVTVATERDGLAATADERRPIRRCLGSGEREPLDLLAEHDGPVEAFCPFLDSDRFPSLAVFDREGTVDGLGSDHPLPACESDPATTKHFCRGRPYAFRPGLHCRRWHRRELDLVPENPAEGRGVSGGQRLYHRSRRGHQVIVW